MYIMIVGPHPSALHLHRCTLHHESSRLSLLDPTASIKLKDLFLSTFAVQENGLAEREGVEMRIVGDLSLLPSAVQGAAARLMQNTASLKRCHAVLNICFSYT